MEERAINLKFEKVQVIIEEEIKINPKPSYSHCSNLVSMILFISLIMTIITAGSLLMIIPMGTLIVSGIIYIHQLYRKPMKYCKRYKKIRKGR